jgi:hypothetical protein
VRYAYPIIILFGVQYVFEAVFSPPLDGDLGWQRWLGRWIVEHGRIPRALGEETFSAAGAAWTPQEWAFSLLAYAGTAGPAKVAFSLMAALCAVGVLWLVARRCAARGAAPIATALVLVLAGISLDASFGVRAQVVGWLCFAAFLTLIESVPPKFVAAFIVAAVWSNLHGSAMLACVLAGVYAAATVLEDRAWTPAVRGAVLFALLMPVAVSLNPFGVGLPRYAVELFNSPIRPYIQEWRPTTIHQRSFLYGSFPILLGLCAFGIRGSRRWFDRLLVLTFTALVFTGARHMAIFGIALAPILASALTGVLARVIDPARVPPRRMVVALCAFALLFGVTTSVLRARQPDFGNDKMPHGPLRAIAAEPRVHDVFCADFTWCSLLLQYPNAKSFLDGRADPFPAQVWERYADVVYLRTKWKASLEQSGADTLIVGNDAPLDQAMARLPGWRRVMRDKAFSLYERGPAAQALEPARPGLKFGEQRA